MRARRVRSGSEAGRSEVRGLVGLGRERGDLREEEDAAVREVVEEGLLLVALALLALLLGAGRGGRGGRGTKGGDGTAIADALRALGGSTKTVDEEKELVKAQTEATRNEDIRGWMSIKASLPIDAQIKLDEKALAAIDAL